MRCLILLGIGVLMALAAVCSVRAPAVADGPRRPEVNPIVINIWPIADVSVEVTRGGQPLDTPATLTIECFAQGRSQGSRSFSCPSYPCIQRIQENVFVAGKADLPLDGPFDCCNLTGTVDGAPINITGYTASPFVCGAPEGGPIQWESDGNGRQNVIRPCTLAVDLQSESRACSRGLLGWVGHLAPCGSPFGVALLLAFLVEIPTVWLLARFAFRMRELRLSRVVVVGLLATALTLPVLWFVVPGLLVTWPGIAAGELLVVGVEGVIYAGLLGVGLPQALVLSLAANAASFAAGLVVL
jgi:hypothetical protein